MGELAKIENYCELSKTNLVFKRDITKEEWMDVFKSLKMVEGCVQFWIGDCLAYRQQKWGMYDDIAQETGYEIKALQNIKSVADKIESSRRREDLSFSHHVEVASLPPQKQEIFLKRAVMEGLSVRELREEIRKEGIKFNSDIILPNRKYQIIYADPPWQYGNSMPGYFKEQANYYPLMTIDEICNLPIRELSDNNSALFLWVTSPILEESFRVINAWGFEYKTSFIWDKIKHTMGHYSSVRHELLLLCIKGTYPIQNIKLYDSVYSEERTEHSKKPDFYYEMIEYLYPNSNKIELFARNKRDNWDNYGNQL